MNSCRDFLEGSEYHLECLSCKAKFGMDYAKQTCGKCGGILEVVYEKKRKFEPGSNFWDFSQFLPLGNYRHYYAGSTRAIYENGNAMKLELDNPTNSFKDRGSVIEVAKAVEYGYNEIVCASTGNMAYSIAYFSKLFGIKSKIFVSSNVNADKARDIRETHDASVTKVHGDFTEAQRHAFAYAKRYGAFLAGDYCYRKEGQKTIAYELADAAKRLGNIVVPVGNGTLFTALYKGFLDIGIMPRLIGVEAAGCAPLATALKTGKPIKHIIPKTKADAIAVGMPGYGMQAIEAVKASKGAMLTMKDSELADAQKAFLGKYGIAVELGGIAAYAAAKKHLHSSYALILTGGNI